MPCGFVFPGSAPRSDVEVLNGTPGLSSTDGLQKIQKSNILIRAAQMCAFGMRVCRILDTVWFVDIPIFVYMCAES